jgi:transposase
MDTTGPARKPYQSDVSDEEWVLAAPNLAPVRADAPQRRHDLREVFNATRWVVRTGAPWRWLPHDLPPWDACRPRRAAGCRRASSSRSSPTCG